MKLIKLFIFIIGIIYSVPTNAQFLKKLGKKAEEASKRALEKKVEEKSERETEKAFDSVFTSKKSEKKKRKRKKRKSKNDEESSNTNSETSSPNETENSANYNSDFEAGKQVIFQENFKNDALNDFPVTWNTDGSGALVTFGNNSVKWLRMDPGVSFMPEGITTIPNNVTIEFDLKVDDNYYQISKGIDIVLAQFNNREKDFFQYYQYAGGKTKNSIEIQLDPVTHVSRGSYVRTYIDGKKNIDKSLGKNSFNKNNRTVHIAIWRQETRLRFYIDGIKIWDLPRAFSKNINYNTLFFGTYKGKPDDAFYITNIRMAKAGADKRHALLEKGTFTTNDILFESGKSTLKASSENTIQELVNALNSSPNTKVKIIGHTDSDGDETANLKLSQERAYAVKEKMIKLGITNYNRITTEGKGEMKPIASNNTPEGKAKNRRVEFSILN